MCDTSLIVVGEMNTDIVVSGLPRFPKAGELVNGKNLSIGPGGKSRNIAAMAGNLMPSGSVAMISKTVKDQYGLWEVPLRALQDVGVDTQYVTVLPVSDDMLPGFAVILVDDTGNNEIIGAPGITRSFSIEDLEQASELFEIVGANHGYMAFIGNCPIEVAKHAINKARVAGIKVVFDPGGADDVRQLGDLLDESIYLFKPNEHEAGELSGMQITDFTSAKRAAQTFQNRGVANVMITAGSQGAYLFGAELEVQIPIPEVATTKTVDETGCGDQTMAALCAHLQAGKSLPDAAKLAVLAGTLQFHKAGIQPITKAELEAQVY